MGNELQLLVATFSFSIPGRPEAVTAPHKRADVRLTRLPEKWSFTFSGNTALFRRRFVNFCEKARHATLTGLF
jgi:hypothetical protein